MAENTGIEWCDSTFNPWTGCTKVGPGCDHCYAEAWAKRSGTVQWGLHAERRRTSASNWKAPLHWEREHVAFEAQHGRRRRVFCASLADVFDNQVPAQWRIELLRLIDSTRNLDWLLLTKRIGNAAAMLETAMRAHTAGRDGWVDNYLPNVWLGATVVNQQEADRDIPKLLTLPAAVRFLSIEPMLGPVDLAKAGALWADMNDNIIDAAAHGKRGIDQVICGGESGAGARPMHPDWARRLRDQCADAGAAYLMKQWGEWCTRAHLPDQTGDSIYTPDLSRQRVKSLAIDHTGATSALADTLQGDLIETVYRVGKKAAGRMLDGREHNDFPETT